MDTLVILGLLLGLGAVTWLIYSANKKSQSTVEEAASDVQAAKNKEVDVQEVQQEVAKKPAPKKKSAPKKPNFSAMTKKELVEYAAGKGHKLPSYLSKDKMIDVVKSL